MPFDNPDDAYGLLPSMSFEGTTLAGNVAFIWSSRVPVMPTATNVFSGVTTSDGKAGIPAVMGAIVPISTIINPGGQITAGTLYNLFASTGEVDYSTAGGTAVKAQASQLHSGGGSADHVVLWFEIWRPRG
jgi:hypothetical protein